MALAEKYLRVFAQAFATYLKMNLHPYQDHSNSVHIQVLQCGETDEIRSDRLWLWRLRIFSNNPPQSHIAFVHRLCIR